ncbi:MAG TPA: phosphoribosylaminoimidazolesuccinocarboxamide synthase [Candidatus Cloacimonas acidaminovorans]|jgi:phosphoribosylaminoimidazole-succinocarboxamide synthase|nr:phosphoribosylaminoimidazolesuccinocarboxamide synthase [Candidatus Cloacimonas acidaminovorans]
MYNEISQLPLVQQSRQGKVRDIYDLGETLLIVSTDRISAFDVVFPTLIPDKGKILNAISVYFFNTTKDIVPNHFITADISEYPVELQRFGEYLEERSMLVKKTRVIPFECIVRGYLSGSAWKEYKKSNTIGGMLIAEEMQESQKFPNPLFTPSTKAEKGHDENISYREFMSRMDEPLAVYIKDKSLELYSYAHDLLLKKGIILADTKFEFGTIGSEVLLIDELFTPDSSRLWSLEDYEMGKSPKSYDKQFIRDYLENSGWDKQSLPPPLPEEVIEQTRQKYLNILKIITGKEL